MEVYYRKFELIDDSLKNLKKLKMEIQVLRATGVHGRIWTQQKEIFRKLLRLL